MDIEALERLITMGPPTNNMLDVYEYYRELSCDLPELIAAARREQEMRALLERARGYVKICAIGFSKDDEEAKALLEEIQEALK